MISMCGHGLWAVILKACVIMSAAALLPTSLVPIQVVVGWSLSHFQVNTK
jgi:hypothetical protein